jgi:uncharacterized membrane protein
VPSLRSAPLSTTSLPAPAREPVVPRESLPTLGGLVLIAALLPLRAYWAAGIVSLGLVFIMPGLVLLRCIGIPAVVVRRFPLYIPAASLLVVMVAGLACDLLGPPLGLARPMHGNATAFSVLGLSLLLWLGGLRLGSEPYVQCGRALRRPVLLLPLALPLLAAAGAMLLNDNRGATAARVAVIVVVVVLFACVLAAGRLDAPTIAMLLFGCSLAAAWSFSLRSQEVIGFDITTEYFIAHMTQLQGVWHPYRPGNAYAAMLSLTVLPSTLGSLSGCSVLVLFKVVYPMFGAMAPVGIFLIARRFTNDRFAAGAAAVLLVQDYFFQGLPGLARQEIATLLFVALIATLCSSKLSRGGQICLAALLSAGMVLSHYTTTYVTITIFAATLVVLAVTPVRSPHRRLPAALVVSFVVLVAGAGVWYAVITDSANELSSFVSTLRHQGLDLLPNAKGGVVSSYLNGNTGGAVTATTFEHEAVNNYRLTAPYLHPIPAAFEAKYKLQNAFVPSPHVRAPGLQGAWSTLYTVFSELILLAGGVGTLLMLFGRDNRTAVRRFGALALGTVLFLGFIRFSGTAASFYNQTRALMQALVVLTIPMAWLVERIYRASRRLSGALWVVIALALGLVFAEQIGASAIVVGGGTSFNLAQGGEDFERQYMTPAELASAQWIEAHSPDGIVQSDRYGQLRISATTGRVVPTNLTPETIDRDAWVYATRTNIVLGRARGQVGSSSATYQWPNAFLDDNFDVVYDNGDSKDYHR